MRSNWLRKVRFNKKKEDNGLIINPNLFSNKEHEMPFHVGQPDINKGFIHVFDEKALNLIFIERDTISDFLHYLVKRRSFLLQGNLTTSFNGERELIGLYLSKINSNNEHDFVMGTNLIEEIKDQKWWTTLFNSKEYQLKKKEEVNSYYWDMLIEKFSHQGKSIKKNKFENISFSFLESGVRILAEEDRLNRRYLTNNLFDFLNSIKKGGWHTRVVLRKEIKEKIYVFLCFEKLPNQSFKDYIIYRQGLLLQYCEAVRKKHSSTDYIIGLAFSPKTDSSPTEDLIILSSDKLSSSEFLLPETKQRENKFYQIDTTNIIYTKFNEYPKP